MNEWLAKAKEFVGIKSHPETEEKAQPSKLPDFITKNEFIAKYGTVFLIAMGVTKILSPLKLGITAAIVPSVARLLRKVGYVK